MKIGLLQRSYTYTVYIYSVTSTTVSTNLIGLLGTIDLKYANITSSIIKNLAQLVDHRKQLSYENPAYNS